MADAERPSPTWTTPAPPGTRRLGPFAALDHHFEVVLPDGPLVDEITRVLEDLALPPHLAGPVGLGRYRVRSVAGDLTLSFDNDRIDAGPGPAHVLAMLLWDVNRRAVEETAPRDLVLHAGAVEVAGRAIVLPAAMESGKTTLVTGLVRAGCGYLSDELACLPDPGAHVRAYPKALSLDPGSWSLFPELAPSESSLAASPNQWLVTADTIRPGATTPGPVPLGRVVLPMHRPGSDTSMTRLPPVQALRAVAACTFGFHEDPGRLFPRLARMADAVPVDALVVGDGVAAAVDLLLDDPP